jgi:hypothetical protein
MVSESKSPVCAIPVIPNGAMRTHNDHAIEKGYNEKFDTEIFKNKKAKKNGEENYHQPGCKRKPVFFIFKNI